MAREIYASYDLTATLYALIRQPSTGYIYNTDTGDLEAVGTWNDARAADCAYPLSVEGNLHVADFPELDSDAYLIEIRVRAGASPVASPVVDWPHSQGFMQWNGIAEIETGNVQPDIADVRNAIDALRTEVISKQLNVIRSGPQPETEPKRRITY